MIITVNSSSNNNSRNDTTLKVWESGHGSKDVIIQIQHNWSNSKQEYQDVKGVSITRSELLAVAKAMGILIKEEGIEL